MKDRHDPSTISILIVDDEFSVRDSLTKWFREYGYEVESAATGRETLKKASPGRWDVALLDIKLPDTDGTELNRQLKEIDPNLTTIMITAYASVDSAVKSLKDGAEDYVTKPVDPDYLAHMVARITERKRIQSENVRLKNQIQELYEHHQIVGSSPAINRVMELIQAVAPTDTTVMVRGESGTGKELIARSIHSTSPRRFFPIITINCGGLTTGLAESELFGHEKGAFTGAVYRRKGKLELADQGTVFLDEIGNIDAKTQSDLLRVIETGQFTRVGGNDIVTVDFRLICATNRNLEIAVEKGDFREDLYYRLNVFSIQVPPLRERKSDIAILADCFLKRLASNMNKPITGFTDDALEILNNYNWPGNVRELHNAIERAVVVSQGPLVKAEALPFLNGTTNSEKDQSLETIELAHIQKVLETTGGNVSRSAEILNIDRKTLYLKIEKFGLRR